MSAIPKPCSCGLCPLCTRLAHPKFAFLFVSGPRGAEQPPTIALPVCVHFTDTITDHTNPDGEHCGCQAKKLYGCDLHGQCARTRIAARPGVICCEDCTDYEPDEVE